MYTDYIYIHIYIYVYIYIYIYIYIYMYRSEKRTESTRSLLRHTERAQLKMLDDGQVGYVYILYIYIYRCRSVDQKSES